MKSEIRTLAIDLLEEVVSAHRDIESPDYNECEKDMCQWCEDANKVLKEIKISNIRKSLS